MFFIEQIYDSGYLVAPRARFQCSSMPPILMFNSLHAIGGNFACLFFLSSLDFLRKKNVFKQNNQSVQQFGSKPGC